MPHQISEKNFSIWLKLAGPLLGILSGLVFYGLLRRYPESGIFFLLGTMPTYLSWKISGILPAWGWFILYFVFIFSGIGWLISRRKKWAFRISILSLLILMVAHYLVIFLFFY